MGSLYRTLALVAILALFVPVSVLAQTPACPGELADQQLEVEYPIEGPFTGVLAKLDSTMTGLGYERAEPPSKGWAFVSMPRHEWPEGTQGAPWRTAGPAPGVQLAVQLKTSGKKETKVQVRGAALCALHSREASRQDTSVEHSATLFAAMQIVVALSAGVEKALHAFDR